MGFDQVKDMELLLQSESKNLLEDFTGVWLSDEAANVNIHKRGHEKLAVKAVLETTISWNGVSEVLHSKRSFEATGEKATKWSHDGGKAGESEAVDLEWIQCHCGPGCNRLQYRWQDVILKLEEFRRLTVHCETAKVVIKLHRTHKVGVTCHYVGKYDPKHNTGEEATDKPIPRLFQRQLDEKGAKKKPNT